MLYNILASMKILSVSTSSLPEDESTASKIDRYLKNFHSIIRWEKFVEHETFFVVLLFCLIFVGTAGMRQTRELLTHRCHSHHHLYTNVRLSRPVFTGAFVPFVREARARPRACATTAQQSDREMSSRSIFRFNLSHRNIDITSYYRSKFVERKQRSRYFLF